MLSRVKTLSANQFTLITALFYVGIFNIPLFQIVKQGIEKQAEVNYLFIATIPLFLIFALSFIFSLFSVKYLLKPFFIMVTLISSSVFFAALQYGVVFDYGMIENTVQTNSAEALTYLNWSSILNFTLTGLLPALLILKADIVYKPFVKELLHKLAFMFAMLAGIAVIGFFYYQNYVAFGRNNDQMKRYIVPTYAIGSMIKYVKVNYFQEPLVYKVQGKDAKNLTLDHNGKPNLVVVVVGETARAHNYEYYGYDKLTNAHTKAYDMIAFKDTESCGTATAVSLPCMFSSMDREDYDARRAQAQDTAMDVLDHAGISLNWLDNDSGCKGVCDRVKHINIDLNSDPELCDGHYCYDQVLLNELDKRLGEGISQDTLIVLHIIGSHGPTYYLRYPEAHRKFVPDCQRSDIQNCSNEELMNTYDNTILYSDYIIAQVISRLEAQQNKADTALLYVSDHGESLGESGMYLHGAPYAIAPDEQIKIPMLAWLSADFASDNGLDKQCLREYATKGGFSHDNLFSSLLGLMNVSTEVYRKEMDLFATCRVK
ncbi:phosphoethanolamine transferase [Shewanella sp. KCT]|uniref:phosphoethanolamine transferase n=1 Tax=Shewanella sp. KCT TaxID=2569535 RepID=UPI00118390B5|nr:phosphoethanolamine--lipid A transferase [Shewanella sp. KCT]TVP09974.1 hydrolase [Shewanella sp. KCT]